MTVSILHSTQGICNCILEKEVKKDGKIYYFVVIMVNWLVRIAAV